MVDWRKQSNYGIRPEYQRRINYRKPDKCFWKPTIPAWEKEFCATVGPISWKNLLESKKYICFHKNVLKWNDSAGEEAFHNAKNRFWAARNGLSCHIPSPDPDMYIDQIDWNPTINEDLMSALDHEAKIRYEDDRAEISNSENEPIVPTGWRDYDDEKDESDLAIFLNRPFMCKGWGDEWEEIDETDLKKSNEIIDGEWAGWDDYWRKGSKFYGRDDAGWTKGSGIFVKVL